MIEYLPLVILAFELIAAILALINYKKYKNTKEKYFLFFLWIVVIIEIYGSISKLYLKENIGEIYNMYLILSFLFYFFWYHSILDSEKQKNILKFLSVIYVLIAIRDLLSKNDMEQFFFTTFIAGAVIVLISSYFYFSQLLKSNEILNVKNNLRFWIVTGLMLFNIGLVPFMIFSAALNSYSYIYMGILLMLNFVLYSCYSIGFICNKQTP